MHRFWVALLTSRVGLVAALLGSLGCGRGGETPSRPAETGVAAELGVASGVAAGEASKGAYEGPAAAQSPAATPPAEDGAAPADEAAEAPDKPLVVTIVVGSFAEDLRAAVETGLRESLPIEVRRGPTWDLPQSAYYPPRRRYRADTLIDLLSEAAREDREHPEVRYLGLTSVDISTTKGRHKDWGIFGLAFSPGQGAVISSHRLKKKAKGREHVAFRVTNTAIHEVGHSLGLAHCAEPRCPMQDAEGSIANTDSSDQVLGPECAAQLAGGG